LLYLSVRIPFLATPTALTEVTAICVWMAISIASIFHLPVDSVADALIYNAGCAPPLIYAT